MNIFITRNGAQAGPYTPEQVQSMLAAGTLVPADLAWHEGLPNWVPLSQIAGLSPVTPVPMAVAPAAPDVPVARPVGVWIICLFFFTCMPCSLASICTIPTIMANQATLPESQRHFFESQGALDYYVPSLINAVLVLVWAIQLFRLKRNSIYFLLATLGIGLIMFLVHLFSSEWLKMVGVFGLVGVGIGWVINFGLLYYNWHLIQTRVLR